MADIIFDKEKIISQAPADVTQWGRWQFPRGYAVGGDIYVEFDDSNDSAAGYNLPKKRYKSSDGGETWHENGRKAGILLPNGDMIRPLIPDPVPMDKITYPECIGERTNYDLKLRLYLASTLPPEFNCWYIERYSALTGTWQAERVEPDFPENIMYTEGTVLQPNFFWDLKSAPDGSVWGIWYGYMMHGAEVPRYGDALFFKSTDNGHTWQRMGAVIYDPKDIAPHDSLATERFGFTEPDIGFHGGLTYSVLRTMDARGNAPSYIVYSADGGMTWSKPRKFDNFGVWPRNISLADGSVLEAFGRPGISLKLLRGGRWGERFPVPGLRDSCGYCDLIPLQSGDGNDALLVYSDFSYPGPDGQKHKTILCRRVRPSDISPVYTTVASAAERDDVFAIRKDVFVIGQNIDASLEYDSYDEPDSPAVHFLLKYKGHPAGACRLISYHDGFAKLQRVAVRQEYRNLGLGKALVQFAEAYASAAGYVGIVLDAQVYVRGFYGSMGYTEPTGEIFQDAGIPHVRMTRLFD